MNKSGLIPSTAILADRYMLELVGQAAHENLLALGGATNVLAQARRLRSRSGALGLLMLFDSLLLPDFEVGLRIPILEDAGFLKRIPTQVIPPFEQSEAQANRFNPAVVSILRDSEAIRPLVVHRVASHTTPFINILSKTLQISQVEVVNAIIDFSLAHLQDDEAGVRDCLLSSLLPEDLIQDFRKGFNEDVEGDRLNAIDAIIVGAVISARQISTFLELSISNHACLATQDYTNLGQYPSISNGVINNPVGALHLMRHELVEHRFGFPLPQTIQQAVVLRRDPNLQAFRRQLWLFHSELSAGNLRAVEQLRREVSRAAEGLQRVSGIERVMRVVTYFSVPTTIAEALLGSPPIVSGGLTALAVLGQGVIDVSKRQNSWVLFGR